MSKSPLLAHALIVWPVCMHTFIALALLSAPVLAYRRCFLHHQHRSLSRLGLSSVQPETIVCIGFGLPGNFFYYHCSPIWQLPWFTFQLLWLFIVVMTVTREQLLTFIGSAERKTVTVASWKLSIGFIIRRNQWCRFWVDAFGIHCKQCYRNKPCLVLMLKCPMWCSENPEWKPALVTGVFGFLWRAPGIVHCSLVDLSNCNQQTHLMLSQETLWDILENGPDPTQSLALNSLPRMKAQSWPVPSVFLHAVSKVCS